MGVKQCSKNLALIITLSTFPDTLSADTVSATCSGTSCELSAFDSQILGASTSSQSNLIKINLQKKSSTDTPISISNGGALKDKATTQQKTLSDIQLSVFTNSTTSLDPVTVDLTGPNSTSWGRKLTFVGDYLPSLTINHSGYVGTKGKDADELCYEALLDSSNTSIPLTAKTRALARRSLTSQYFDPLAPTNKCDSTDISLLQSNSFACSEVAPSYRNAGIFSADSTPNPSIEIDLFKRQLKCQATLRREVCQIPSPKRIRVLDLNSGILTSPVDPNIQTGVESGKITSPTYFVFTSAGIALVNVVGSGVLYPSSHFTRNKSYTKNLSSLFGTGTYINHFSESYDVTVSAIKTLQFRLIETNQSNGIVTSSFISSGEVPNLLTGFTPPDVEDENESSIFSGRFFHTPQTTTYSFEFFDQPITTHPQWIGAFNNSPTFIGETNTGTHFYVRQTSTPNDAGLSVFSASSFNFIFSGRGESASLMNLVNSSGSTYSNFDKNGFAVKNELSTQTDYGGYTYTGSEPVICKISGDTCPTTDISKDDYNGTGAFMGVTSITFAQNPPTDTSYFFVSRIFGAVGLLSMATDDLSISEIIPRDRAAGIDDGLVAQVKLSKPTSPVVIGDEIYFLDRRYIFSANLLRKINVKSGTASTIPVRRLGSSGDITIYDPSAEVISLSASASFMTHKDGFLYIADTGNHVIRKLNPTSGMSTVIMGVEGQAGDFTSGFADSSLINDISSSCQIDSLIYFADPTTHTVKTLNRTTNQTSLYAGISGTSGSANGSVTSATFNRPKSVTCDNVNKVIYVSDMGNAVIRGVNVTSGFVYLVAGTVGTRGLTDGAGGIFTAPMASVLYNSKLYIIDSNTVRSLTLDSSKTVTTLAGSLSGDLGFINGTGSQARFTNITALAIHQTTGDIYLADSGNNVIRKVSQSGLVSTFYGKNGAKGAILASPSGVALDGDLLYVSDSYAVYSIDIGSLTTKRLTGFPGVQGQEDGGSGKLSGPKGISVANGVLVIAGSSGRAMVDDSIGCSLMGYSSLSPKKFVYQTVFSSDSRPFCCNSSKTSCELMGGNGCSSGMTPSEYPLPWTPPSNGATRSLDTPCSTVDGVFSGFSVTIPGINKTTNPLNNYYDPATNSLKPSEAWYPIGYVRESFASETSTEAILCGITGCTYSNSFDQQLPLNIVTQLRSKLTQLSITPGPGEDGTPQGYGKIFVYETPCDSSDQCTVNQARPFEACLCSKTKFSYANGAVGPAGLVNITNPGEIRACYLKNDLSTDPFSTNYGAMPVLDYKLYDYRSIEFLPGGNPANPPPNLDRRTYLYKRLDESVLHLLKNQN